MPSPVGCCSCNINAYVSVTIASSPKAVYDYASNPENLPKWASGLSKSKIEKSGGAWIADSPMGKVKVKFVEKNPYGILDHDVTLPDGSVFYNPLRVVKNHDGSEIIFTVFRHAGMSDQDFAKDISTIKKDLETLKRRVE